MPGSFGGMSPFAFQFGGGPRNLEVITQSLNAARGAAFDASTWSSTVSIENRAIGRVLKNLWATNSRAQNQFDPTRTTDLLPRWERIEAISPLPTDSDGDRRTRLTFKWQQSSKEPWYQQIVDDLTTLMGSQVFLGLSHLPSESSRAIFPGNNAAGIVSGVGSLIGGSGYGVAPTLTLVGGGGAGATATASISGGSVVTIVITYRGFGYTSAPAVVFSAGNASATVTVSTPGLLPNPYDLAGTTTLGSSWVDWASGVSHIGVHIRHPAGISNAAFQAAVNAGSTYLDGALPAWCQFSMFQTPGFLLDQANFGVASLAS